MVFLILAWLIAAAILLAVDVVGWLRRRGQQRSWLRSVFVWGFALALAAFALFWFTF